MNFKLAELRKKQGMTQQELGDILCVSYQTISKWENGVVYPDIEICETNHRLYQQACGVINTTGLFAII